jgi:hypothetical protein
MVGRMRMKERKADGMKGDDFIVKELIAELPGTGESVPPRRDGLSIVWLGFMPVNLLRT